jgi:uncharacterized protein YbcI
MDLESTSHGPSGHDRGGMELSEISNAMVRLYKDQFGRGPTKAATHYAGPDCLISTLENSLTPAERNMVAMGEHQRLRDVRLLFQHATEQQFREIIERITGRTVRGFVSGMDTSNDISSEVFYLEPVDGAQASTPQPN